MARWGVEMVLERKMPPHCHTKTARPDPSAMGAPMLNGGAGAMTNLPKLSDVRHAATDEYFIHVATQPHARTRRFDGLLAGSLACMQLHASAH